MDVAEIRGRHRGDYSCEPHWNNYCVRPAKKPRHSIGALLWRREVQEVKLLGGKRKSSSCRETGTSPFRVSSEKAIALIEDHIDYVDYVRFVIATVTGEVVEHRQCQAVARVVCRDRDTVRKWIRGETVPKHQDFWKLDMMRGRNIPPTQNFCVRLQALPWWRASLARMAPMREFISTIAPTQRGSSMTRTPRFKNIPRSTDERHLLWLKGRCAGRLCRDIAAADGVSMSAVSLATKNIRAADVAESGEDVKGLYW